jgi:hydrogenase expression/formation protein HypC
MCLGAPGQIVEVKPSGEALVDFWGVRKLVRLDTLAEPVLIGSYVIEHAGFAVRVIPPADVQDTLALYEILLTEAGEDPIARDIADGFDCLELEPEPLAFV